MRHLSLVRFVILFAGLAGLCSAQSLGRYADFSGTLSFRDVRTYTAIANAGETLILRVAETGEGPFEPRIHALGPDGLNRSVSVKSKVAGVAFAADVDGQYTFVVSHSDTSKDGTASYSLHFLLAPGSVEPGSISNGETVQGTIDAGDLDHYFIAAKKGQTLIASMAKESGASLTPRVTIYGPDGEYRTFSSKSNVARADYQATVDGSYTIVLDDGSFNMDGSGGYSFSFVLTPGVDEGQPLVNGATIRGAIEPGDLDAFRIPALRGETLIASMAKEAGSPLKPMVIIYAPDGTYKTYSSKENVARVSYEAAEDGNYTVVLCDGDFNFDGWGGYDFSFVLTPGVNEAPALVNGRGIGDSIPPGDLDSYRIDAKAGQNIILSMATDTSASLDPYIALYGPDGGYLTYVTGNTVARLQYQATTDGPYTAVLCDGNFNYDGAGKYILHYVLTPGVDEGGKGLKNSGWIEDSITIGDVDSYVVPAIAGQFLVISVVSAENSTLNPQFIIFAPDGSYQTYKLDLNVTQLFYKALVDGNHTIVVCDGDASREGEGAYRFHFVKPPGFNQSIDVAYGVDFNSTLAKGALHTYVKTLRKGDTLDVGVTALVSTLRPMATLYGPSGDRITFNASASAAKLRHIAQADGKYTLVVSDDSPHNTGYGPYTIRISNSNPALPAGLKQTRIRPNSPAPFSSHLAFSEDDIIGIAADVIGSPTVTWSDGTTVNLLPGQVLRTGDVVRTGSGESVDLEFGDHTVYHIDSDATVNVEEYFYFPEPQPERPFNFLRSIFLWGSEFIKESEIEKNPPTGCCGIRGDAAEWIENGKLDVAVRMTVGSPISLYRAIKTPADSFPVHLDYYPLEGSGELTLAINGVTVLKDRIDSGSASKKKSISLMISDPALRGLTVTELSATFDGTKGSQILIGRFSWKDSANQDFSEYDRGWFAKGPGKAELVGIMSKGSFAELTASTKTRIRAVRAPRMMVKSYRVNGVRIPGAANGVKSPARGPVFEKSSQ